uniref:Uncharacterized protein n=1 Tax=viral metagenome TaxID=1070528 RepID=A0A6H1ZJL7_9ZZZZ
MANAFDGNVVALDTFTSDVSLRVLMGRTARRGSMFKIKSISWGEMTAAHLAKVRVGTSTGPPLFSQTAAANNGFYHAYYGGALVSELYLVSAENTGGKIIIVLE